MRSNEVIVGVDGSAPSLAAVRWATREAARRGVPVRVVNAYHFVVVGAYAPVGGAVASEAQGAAKSLVDRAVAEAKTVAGDVEVTGTTVLGPPAQALLEAGRKAGMIVVGSRGHGGFAGVLLGATGQQVALHATCPVVIVRGRDDAAKGPVAVGVDGSPSAEHALDLAFGQASARGCGVLVVRAYEWQMPPYGTAPMMVYETPEEVHSRARAELAENVAKRQANYPQVPVEQIVVRGGAAQALADVSKRAQLVVVGTRGHGGFAGLLLGSVGLHLIHHADCPVLVARAVEPRIDRANGHPA